MTRAPSRASPVAMANPIPLVEAETRAVLSPSFRFIDQMALRQATPNEIRSFSKTSLCGLRFDSSSLGPDILEDKSSDDETKKDSDDAIPDVIEIGVGRVTLENAVEES